MPKTISISWGLGLVEPRLTLVEASTLVGRGSRPQEQGTRSTTGTFTFSFPVLFFFSFFFKPKEAGSEKTAQQYRPPWA